MRKLHLATTLLATLGLTAGLSGQLLSNGDFETGDLSGWTTLDNGGTVMASTNYAQGGLNSLMIDSTGAGAWSSPQAYQTLPANPGELWNLSGYILNPSGDPITDASFGLYKIVFKDSGGVDLVPDTATVGTINTQFPGIESAPLVNLDSSTDAWIFSEAGGVAPAGTAEVVLYALNVNQGTDPGAIYFDSITAVPEPAFYAAILGLLTLGFIVYRRRR